MAAARQPSMTPEAVKSRTRRADPDKAEADRKSARAWKAAHPERLERDRKTRTQPCASCGKPAYTKADRCITCERTVRRAKRTARREVIKTMWLAGARIGDIAAVLNSTRGSVGQELHKMRAEGWDVPKRWARRAA